MNVLDLFSGIGGFSLGLERAGMRTVAFCEKDPFCRRVLARHWPGIPIFDNVENAKFPNADIITGGFPCQDLSAMGRRAGLTGVNSGLWREMVRAVRMVRPRYTIMENVADLLDLGLGEILRELASIGYGAEWHCIPAGAVGAPHERDRIWIVAHSAQEPGLHQSMSWEAARGLLNDSSYWKANPWDEATSKLCRVDDGVPHRVDRTGALGNSLTPQIAELIGRAIMELDS